MAGLPSRPAEARRLVPAVAGGDEPLHHLLHVPLHGLGLASQLSAPGMGEAGARLGLQLVAGEVLGVKREGVGEIGVEVGRALAGDPVEEVEREVVDPRGPQRGHRLPHLLGRGPPLEDGETRVTPCARRRETRSRVTVSGFASTVTSSAGGRAASRRDSAAGSVKVGVPPPRYTVSSLGAKSSRSSSSSRRRAST